MCRHTAVYVSSYYYMCPELLYIYVPRLRVHTDIYVSAYCYICVRILLYMCPHTAVYVSSYYYICASSQSTLCTRTTTSNSLRPICMCPYAAICVSSYCYICVLILLYMSPHTALQLCMCLVSEYVVHKDYDIKLTKADLTTNGTQFTCFTGTKVQMLTPEELQSTASTSSKCSRRRAAGLPGEAGRDVGGVGREGGSGGRVRAILVQKYKY
jgi:hypothetical protein